MKLNDCLLNIITLFYTDRFLFKYHFNLYIFAIFTIRIFSVLELNFYFCDKIYFLKSKKKYSTKMNFI